MATFVTIMQVMNQQTKQLVWVEAERIEAKNWEEAQKYIDEKNLNWLVIEGEFIEEVPYVKYRDILNTIESKSIIK